MRVEYYDYGNLSNEEKKLENATVYVFDVLDDDDIDITKLEEVKKKYIVKKVDGKTFVKEIQKTPA